MEPTDKAVCILLSYARPQNIQRMVDTVLQSSACGRLILSNNNPDIDIHEFIKSGDDRVEITQSPERRYAVERFVIARECPEQYFLCIDDDLFVSPDQIEQLIEALIREPERPHGMYGEIVHDRDGQLTVETSIHRYDGELDVLNRIYAFTRDHVRRFFEIADLLGTENIDELGPIDDIVLSHSGNSLPRCHDFGDFWECPTSNQKGVALWQEADFLDLRLVCYRKLQKLMNRKGAVKRPS